MQIRLVRKFTQAPFKSFQALILAFANDRVATGRAHGPKMKILVMELLQNEGFRKQFAKLWRRHIWSDFVASAERFQKEGTLRRDVPPEILAQLCLMVIAGFVATRYLLKLGKSEGAERELQTLLKTLFTGLEPKTS